MKKTPPNTLPESEWFVPVEAARPGESERHKIEADAGSRVALARRLHVVRIDKLTADLTQKARSDGRIEVTGTMKASVVQNCVVTLEPVTQKISEEVEGWFAGEEAAIPIARARRDKAMKRHHAEVEVLDEEDDPEAVVGGRIDLGELVAQHLALAIDPYPHKPGVAHDMTDEDDGEGQGRPLRENPFAALKDWREEP